MTDQDYEILSQFLDGELPSAETQALRKRLLAEPQLRQEFDRLRKLDENIKRAYATPGIEDVPAHVTAMVETTPRRQRSSVWGFAVAASLVAATGLILSNGWQQTAEQYPGTGSDPQLAQLLETTPSHAESWNTLPDGRQARPLLSFQDKSGSWCREYLLSQAGATWRGVACRTTGDWHTHVLALASEEALVVGGGYRTASAVDSDQVASFIHKNAADIALSLSQEAELISRRWQ